MTFEDIREDYAVTFIDLLLILLVVFLFCANFRDGYTTPDSREYPLLEVLIQKDSETEEYFIQVNKLAVTVSDVVKLIKAEQDKKRVKDINVIIAFYDATPAGIVRKLENAVVSLSNYDEGSRFVVHTMLEELRST